MGWKISNLLGNSVLGVEGLVRGCGCVSLGSLHSVLGSVWLKGVVSTGCEVLAVSMGFSVPQSAWRRGD